MDGTSPIKVGGHNFVPVVSLSRFHNALLYYKLQGLVWDYFLWDASNTWPLHTAESRGGFPERLDFLM